MAELAPELQRLIDENAIRNLSMRYAHCVDRLDMDGLAALFTEDGAITGSGVDLKGRRQIAKIADTMRANFDRTYHTTHNHLVTVDGDRAEGEVLSASHHLKAQDDGRTSDLIMTITYFDAYVRQGGAWLFERRRVDLKWTETRWVEGNAKVG
jgi:uncharacterized protein (TIGR02246 family)